MPGGMSFKQTRGKRWRKCTLQRPPRIDGQAWGWTGGRWSVGRKFRWL